MSGHSKFANIKHRKEKQDATRGKIFTKIGREIAVAVREGGADPNNNSKLYDIIAKAKVNNMPNDTIARSVKKAAGEGDGVIYESAVYEGYGPNGVAVIVECLTDNKNRTAANVRHAFSKFGGNMGTTGCVSFMFERKGQFVILKDPNIDEDELMLNVIEAGADDLQVEEEGYEVYTSPEAFGAVNEAIERMGIQPISAEITMIPSTYTELTDEDSIKNMQRIIDQLEDDDDVQNVFTSWEDQ